MGVLVECEVAHDQHGNKVHIADAISGANGYYCPSCGAAMAAYMKRRRNESHFQHLSRFGKEEVLCIWANETHRHKVAKRILQRLKQLRVPNLYALAPPDYDDSKPLPLIKAAHVIEAHSAWPELCVFEDEQGQVRFAKYIEAEYLPCDGVQSNKTLLVRPDIIFLDAQRKPLLFIEIFATHEVGDLKMARLRRLNVPTVEITIRPCHFEADIEDLFTRLTSHTKWLYHPDQYVCNPDDDTVDYTRKRGGTAAAHKRRVFDPGESVKCRTFQVEDALRGVRKRLDGVNHAARTAGIEQRHDEFRVEKGRVAALFASAQAELAGEQDRVKAEIERVNAELRAAYLKVDAEVLRRVAAKRNEYERAAANIEVERKALRLEHEASTRDLYQRLQSGKAALRAAAEPANAEFSRADADLRAKEADLRKHHGELDDLCREEATLDREEAELTGKQETVAAELARTQLAYEQQAQAASDTNNRFAGAYALEVRLRERKQLIARKRDDAHSGRLAI